MPQPRLPVSLQLCRDLTGQMWPGSNSCILKGDGYTQGCLTSSLSADQAGLELWDLLASSSPVLEL